MRAVIDGMFDQDSVLELRPKWADGMITCLARIEGQPVGVIANNPHHLGGAIDATAADKSARFMQLCEAHQLPIVFLCDTPGFMVGPESEQEGMVRRAGRLFVVGSSLSVPIMTIITRKGYGLGAQGMAGGGFKQPLFTVAWPTGEVGGMGLEGAVALGYSKELAAVEDPAEREELFEQMVDRMYQHGKAPFGSTVGSVVAVGSTVGSVVAVGSTVGSVVAVGSTVGSVVAVGSTVGSGVAVAVGAVVGVGEGTTVGVAVGATVGSGVAVAVGEGTTVGVAVGAGVAVAVGTGVAVGTEVGVGVGGTGVAVAVGVGGTGVAVGVGGTGVDVAVGVGGTGVDVAVGVGGTGVAVAVGVGVGGTGVAGPGVDVGVGSRSEQELDVAVGVGGTGVARSRRSRRNRRST
ncbi:putative carboxylase YngE [Nymphon striatum]|nr:putative carboxylase YngE [Nymphon striatum]